MAKKTARRNSRYASINNMLRGRDFKRASELAKWLETKGGFPSEPIGPGADGFGRHKTLSNIVFFENQFSKFTKAKQIIPFVDSIADQINREEVRLKEKYHSGLSGPLYPDRHLKIKKIALKHSEEPNFAQYSPERIAKEYGLKKLAKDSNNSTRGMKKSELMRMCKSIISAELHKLKNSGDIPNTTLQDKIGTTKRLREIPDINDPRVKKHESLVVTILRRTVIFDVFSRKEIKELKKVGMEALRTALERYDPNKINPETKKPYAFSTFAYPTIRGYLLQHITRVLRKPEKINPVSMDAPSPYDERPLHEKISRPEDKDSSARYSLLLDNLFRLNREGKIFAFDITLFMLVEERGFNYTAAQRYFSMERGIIKRRIEKVRKIIAENRIQV